MADEAVMDAAVETPLEQTTEVEESPGESTGLETPESTEIPQDGTQPIPDKPLIDGGKLSADAKKHLEELKVSNPALARAMQRALFKGAEFEKALPGGLKELNTLRETVETLGGENGIQEIQSEVNGFRQFDQQYTAGDPKAIDFMTSDPQGQEAFVKLMPVALQKFEQLHPEGFTGYMAQVMEQSMYASGIPLALERLADFLGDNPKAIEQWNKIAGFLRFVGDTSRKQVEVPKFQQAQPDNKLGEIEQRESALTRNEWKTETAAASRATFDREWARLAGGRKLTAEQTDTINELFQLRFNKAIQNGHAEKLDRYFAAKDKTGFLRYAATLDSSILPSSLKEAFERVLPAKPGPRPGTAPAPARQPAKDVPIAQGFTQIAQQPGTSDIDYKDRRNTTQLFQSGKAFLKDGRRVQWSRA